MALKNYIQNFMNRSVEDVCGASQCSVYGMILVKILNFSRCVAPLPFIFLVWVNKRVEGGAILS